MFKFNRILHRVLSCVLILCLTILCSCQSKAKFKYEYDANTYLIEDTPFEQVARKVMPTTSELENTKITHYEHIKQHSEEQLRISVVYSDENFQIAKQKIDEQYENQTDRASFYFDGMLYNAYLFYVDKGRYIMSYHICSDSNSISYILLENFDFEYLTVTQCFETTYGEHRITPIS